MGNSGKHLAISTLSLYTAVSLGDQLAQVLVDLHLLACQPVQADRQPATWLCVAGLSVLVVNLARHVIASALCIIATSAACRG